MLIDALNFMELLCVPVLCVCGQKTNNSFRINYDVRVKMGSYP